VLRDPVADRLERERLVARAMQRGLAECDAPETLLAAQLDTRPRRVRAWRDAHSSESVPAAQLLGLPPVVRRPVVALLAESLGCSLVDLPESPEVANDARLSDAAAAAASGTAQAVAALAAAAGADDLDEASADRIDAVCAAAVSALLLARETVRTRRRRQPLATVGGRR
jgi:hypothetical protein